jgi:hypothetical protein
MLTPLLTVSLLLAAVPAHAADSVQLPEGSNLTLFALGVLGVVIGRRVSARKRD